MSDTKRFTIATDGGKLFGRCYDCGEVIRFDKPLIGSLHVCVTDEEAAQQPWRKSARRAPRGVQQ